MCIFEENKKRKKKNQQRVQSFCNLEFRGYVVWIGSILGLDKTAYFIDGNHWM